MKSISFADDTNLLYSNKDIDELYIEVAYDIENALDWFRANKLSVNINKTNYMVFKPRGKTDKPILNTLKIDNVILKEVDHTKFLGMWIDNKLSWTEQVYHTKKKLHQCEFILKKINTFLPEKSLKTVYCAHALSHLKYGINLWGCMINDTKVKILKSAQIRCVSQINKNYIRRENLCKEMKILELDSLISFELAKLAFKFKNDELPVNIKILFPKRINHQYNTRNKRVPKVGKHTTCIYSNCFLSETNNEWGKLSQNVKNSKSVRQLYSRFCGEKFK
jgi:hypothetical protein